MDLPINYDETHFSIRKLAREEYAIRQNGLCCHCGDSLMSKSKFIDKKVNLKLFPVSFFKWPVHLHHDRKTGLTIGAVHNHCNAVLWQYHGE